MSSTSRALSELERSPSDRAVTARRAFPAGGPSSLDELREVLGPALIDDPGITEGYRRDQSKMTSAGRPIAVVRARSVEDVQTTIRWAHRHRVAVVTRGAGSGLAGGANALDGCIVLSLAGLNRILHIDPAARLASVEAGVINADLVKAAAEHGLWYPPDPGSRDFSTIGGNVATNAGGACCVKYGVTGDHVVRIKAILPDGRLIHTGAPPRKNVAGLNIGQLLVGSEGTLAVIVEVTVRLRPIPATVTTVVAAFPTPAKAIDVVLAVTGALEPCVMELMDHTTVAAVESMTRMGLDTDAGALLLVQFDGGDASAQGRRCVELCEPDATQVWQTDEPEEGESMMMARRCALPALERSSSSVLLDDVAVPVPQLPGMLWSIERIAERRGVRIGTFGHAGDGNLHPTILFDANDPDESERARLAFDDIVERAVAVGGTIAGEHGVGCLKRDHLKLMVCAAELDLMHRIKKAFDPYEILNPGRGS